MSEGMVRRSLSHAEVELKSFLSSAHMDVEETLSHVGFEWPSERSARLKIRDSVLTFATT